jgi:hypothetical protein
MYIQAVDGKFYCEPVFGENIVGNSVKASNRKAAIEQLSLHGITGKVAVHGICTKILSGSGLEEIMEFEWTPIAPIPIPKTWVGICSMSIPFDVPQFCFWYYFSYRELMDIIGGLRKSNRLTSLWNESSKDFSRWVRRQVKYHEMLHGLPPINTSIYVRHHRFKGVVTSPAFI